MNNSTDENDTKKYMMKLKSIIVHNMKNSEWSFGDTNDEFVSEYIEIFYNTTFQQWKITIYTSKEPTIINTINAPQLFNWFEFHYYRVFYIVKSAKNHVKRKEEKRLAKITKSFIENNQSENRNAIFEELLN